MIPFGHYFSPLFVLLLISYAPNNNKLRYLSRPPFYHSQCTKCRRYSYHLILALCMYPPPAHSVLSFPFHYITNQNDAYSTTYPFIQVFPYWTWKYKKSNQNIQVVGFWTWLFSGTYQYPGVTLLDLAVFQQTENSKIEFFSIQVTKGPKNPKIGFFSIQVMKTRLVKKYQKGGLEP